MLAPILLGTLLFAAPGDGLTRFEFQQVEMAEPIKLIIYADSSDKAEQAAAEVYGCFRRLNGIMSDYDPASELRRLSASAGTGTALYVGSDLWNVLLYARCLSEQSDGAFDVTVGPLVRLWRRARRQAELPSQDRLEEARRAVGNRFIEFDPARQTVKLLRPGMALDLGGIATGYALDQASAGLKKRGISRYLIDASGDIILGDSPPTKPGWTIAVAGLDLTEAPATYLTLSRCAVVTSGDAVQYVEIGGRRYSHLVDPRSGMALTDHSAVTVVAREAVVADGLASAVSVLGPEKGLALIEQTPDCAALIMRSPHGRVERFESNGWKAAVSVPAAP